MGDDKKSETIEYTQIFSQIRELFDCYDRSDSVRPFETLRRCGGGLNRTSLIILSVILM
jgi:hypothetical protein